jgi:ubiquitin-conjugating enzyme E2 J1
MSAGKNPAIKRIHADVRELQRHPSEQYAAAPLEENLFCWHFTLRGPPATEFEGGVYHGKIQLPPEYPFKPPSISFATPNGRFSVGAKICLSFSAHHPETWQPAWGLRLILEALISFFPSESGGALGGLDWSPKERRRLAKESVNWCCPTCGRAADLLPVLNIGESSAAASHEDDDEYSKQLKGLHLHGLPSPSPDAAVSAFSDGANEEKVDNEDEGASSPATNEQDAIETSDQSGAQPRVQPARWSMKEDDWLAMLAAVLVIAIASILSKKAGFSLPWMPA